MLRIFIELSVVVDPTLIEARKIRKVEWSLPFFWIVVKDLSFSVKLVILPESLVGQLSVLIE